MLTLATEEAQIHWNRSDIPILEQSPHHLKIEIDITQHSVESVVASLLGKYAIKDLSIEGPPLETIIQTLYHYGATA